MQPEQHSRFLNFVANPPYDGDSFYYKRMISTDQGETFVETEDYMLFGIYFFAFENRNEYTRDVYNIVDALSDLGGLSTSILAVFGLIGGFINQLFYQLHFVNNLYFIVETIQDGDLEQGHAPGGAKVQ